MSGAAASPGEVAARRQRATLLGLLLFPPLAPAAWAWWAGADRPRFTGNLAFRAGALGFVLVPIGVVGAALTGAGRDPVHLATALVAGWTAATVAMTAGVTWVELALRRERGPAR